MAAPVGNKHVAKWNNPTLMARVVMHARRGRSKTDCFKLVGIHADTGFAWLKYGREHADSEPRDLRVRLFRAMERAVALFSADQLLMIEAAAQSQAPNTWQAAAWLLERRNPKEWGKKDQTTIEAGDKPLLQLNQVVLVDSDARDDARALLRRVAGTDARLALGSGVRGELEVGGDGSE